MEIFLTVGIAVFTAITAFVSATFLERRRKRRELIVGYLVDACKVLYFIVQKGQLPSEKVEEFNDLAVSILLFGKKEQVELMRNFIAELQGGTSSECLKELFVNLINSLRKEVGLEKVEPYAFSITKK